MAEQNIKIYDTEGGSNPKAAEDFIQHLASKAATTVGFDIVIDIGDAKLIAYDLAAFVESLIDAVEYYKSEIE